MAGRQAVLIEVALIQLEAGWLTVLSPSRDAEQGRQVLRAVQAEARARVSRALQEPTPLAERLGAALDAILALEDLGVAARGGVFLRVDSGDQRELELVATRGAFTDEFLAAEGRVPWGECLCGRAAESGEILVSQDCFEDERHQRQYLGMQAHGHYIVPLMASGEALGVLFLYTEPHPTRAEWRIPFLREIGELIGLAITNHHLAERIRVSLQEAEAASRAKTRFLSLVSHEIRNPLTTISSTLQVLKREQAPELVVSAQEATADILRLVTDLLDTTKIEAGKLEVEAVDFDVCHVLSGLAMLHAPQAETKGVKLVLEVDGRLMCAAVGDPLRLRQVLENLLGNAIKFTERGEVRLRARETPREGRRWLEVEVVDSGPGISPKDQERLFTPYAQGSTATARKHGGTGLGLGIARQLTELMGGELFLESELGAGTTARVTMPLTNA